MRYIPKLIILALVAGLALWMWASGFYRELNAEWLQHTVQRAGVFGPIAFVAAFSLFQPLFVSGHIFVLAATLVWEPTIAFGLSWLGAMGCALTSFFFARYLAKDWVQARLPERVKKYDARLAERAFYSVLMLRVVFWTSVPVQMMLGASQVRFRPFLLGTMLGMIPGVLFSFLVGTGIARMLLG